MQDDFMNHFVLVRCNNTKHGHIAGFLFTKEETRFDLYKERKKYEVYEFINRKCRVRY